MHELDKQEEKQALVPDQGGEGQQLAEGQGDKADPSRSGRRPAGHQLQELLCFFIGRPNKEFRRLL